MTRSTRRGLSTAFCVAVAIIACGVAPDLGPTAPDLARTAGKKCTPHTCPDTTTPPDTTPPDTTPTTSGCGSYTYTRRVPVSTATQLQAALTGVQSGDRIELADGTYSLAVRGTVTGRAVLCGSSAAVLTRGTVSTSGYAVWLTGPWVLDGFTVTNAQQGVRIESGRDCAIRNLLIATLGQEAINVRKFSSRCVIEGNTIHDTGKLSAEYGEGVYLGTAYTAWAGVTGSSSTPDRTDSVLVRNNVIGPNVTAEAVDAKEGTTGGVLDGNTFDGHGMVMSQTWVDSWVEVKGNGYRVTNNHGTYSLRDGFQTYQQLAGWGNNNVFRGNTADVQGPGYGFRLNNVTGTVFGCDNVVTNAGLGFANVPCTP